MAMEIVSPRVTTMLNTRLRELGETWADFIRRFHAEHGEIGAKNHLYKILNGTIIVGERGLLPLICKSLNLNYDEVVKAVRRDKIDFKNWDASPHTTNPTIKEITTILEAMPKKDQHDILAYVKMKAGLK